jgi:hypothetical protein
MLVATGAIFTLGVALFLWDFFVLAARRPETRVEAVAAEAATP